MNKRQVIILWIIALALGGAVAALKLSQKDTTKSATNRAPGDTLFESFPATDVSTVEIAGTAGTVTLAKKDGKWTVTELVVGGREIHTSQFDGTVAYTNLNEATRTLEVLFV